MKKLFIAFSFLIALGCSDGKTPITAETEWQKLQNANFKDATKSPLTKQDRKEFNGLNFYKFDSTLVVVASLNRTPDSQWFKMRTTTERKSKERVYGILTFELQGIEFNLNVYQGEENMQTSGFEDYLFLPFLDLTNGETSYGGGRYIDLNIPEGNSIIIDFNKAYNPLCVYNEKYSCPLVPRENFLNISIKAGMMNYD
jgi:hypothetical protein